MRRWMPGVRWVCVVLALLLVAVVAAVEVWQASTYRRTAQNAVDAAALAGVRALVRQYTNDA
jgi:Flp pilus assembly protein TadG